MKRENYDVVIVGGGVTGTALAYALAKYSTVKRVLLLEKEDWVGKVNSNPMNNAQTSHDGGTETNYTLAHALDVKRAATMLRNFCRQHSDPLLSQVRNRMVLAVGATEVDALRARFREFEAAYPDLRLVYRPELERIEPKVVEGRDPREEICALVSDQGYIVNYQRLAETLLSEAQRLNPEMEAVFNTPLTDIYRVGDEFCIKAGDRTCMAKVVAFAAGSYSLFYAQKLGYGLDYAILPVAGSFFSGGPLLKGKVYRVQIPDMPFAAPHADPDILNPDDTRFGPTTMPLPLMERFRYGTLPDFLRLPLVSMRGLWSLLKILHNKTILGYVVKHLFYELPWLGPRLFAREARKIVPTLKGRDLKIRRGAGGIRPQIVDLIGGKLVMGDVTIVGDKCIFNTTPSPGASVCLANARRDAGRLVEMLGAGYEFDAKAFDHDLLA